MLLNYIHMFQRLNTGFRSTTDQSFWKDWHGEEHRGAAKQAAAAAGWIDTLNYYGGTERIVLLSQKGLAKEEQHKRS